MTVPYVTKARSITFTCTLGAVPMRMSQDLQRAREREYHILDTVHINTVHVLKRYVCMHILDAVLWTIVHNDLGPSKYGNNYWMPVIVNGN